MSITGKKETKISVIIPTYNSGIYLSSAIDSVLAQSYDNYEIIVVDDGSTDGTPKLLEIYRNNTKFKYFRQSNKGVSAARNFGASQCSGKYLCFLDADDLFLEENISQKAKILDADPAVGLVHGDVQMISEKGCLLNLYNRGLAGSNLYKDILLWSRCVIPAPSSVMIRKEVFDNIGGWDDQLSTAADQDLFIRICAVSKVERIPKILTYYRIVEGSMSKKAMLFETDHLKVYSKARQAGLFEDSKFERRCYAQLYCIIAAYWWHYDKNLMKFVKFLSLSFFKNPSPIFNRLLRKNN